MVSGVGGVNLLNIEAIKTQNRISAQYSSMDASYAQSLMKEEKKDGELNDKAGKSEETNSSSSKEGRDGELTQAQKLEVAKLQAIDRAVRTHEAAHISAGGEVILSGANFTYTTGPDKKRYATEGEVAIDTSEERTPSETIPKMQKVRTAALAPADPSPQDYKVASTATLLEMKARMELAREDSRSSTEEKDRLILHYQDF